MIKLYTATPCLSCERARNYLKDKKIQFKEINVDGNVKAQHELIEKSGQIGVPVIDIDGVLMIGFNKTAMEQILKT